ncbi:MAG: type II toxin-antitoxin system VapC family toxin, partial [Bacillota bacterium]
MAVVIDTCVVIGFLRGAEPEKSCLANVLKNGEGLLTSITVFELMLGLEQYSKRKNIAQQLVDFLSVVPFNKEAACMAANIERGLRQQGMVIGTRDVFIAGTCLAHGLTIVT